MNLTVTPSSTGIQVSGDEPVPDVVQIVITNSLGTKVYNEQFNAPPGADSQTFTVNPDKYQVIVYYNNGNDESIFNNITVPPPPGGAVAPVPVKFKKNQPGFVPPAPNPRLHPNAVNGGTLDDPLP